MVLALGLIYAVVSSRIGRMLLAIKQNQLLALAHGVNPTPYKLFAFAVAAALTAMAGGVAVRLTPTEWHLVEALVRHPGRLVEQEAPLPEVWGRSYHRETHYRRADLHHTRTEP